jgi:hypothetical protein
MDYHVFVVSRIHEPPAAVVPTRQAVEAGIVPVGRRRHQRRHGDDRRIRDLRALQTPLARVDSGQRSRVTEKCCP